MDSLGIENKSSKTKISIYYVLFLILEFIMIYPNVLNYMPGYNLIRIIQNGLGIISIILLIKFIKVKNIRRLLYIFLAMFLSTLINSSNYSVAWYYYSKSFGLMICLYYLIRLRPFEFLKASSDYFYISLVLNALLTLIRPDGLTYMSSINEVEKGVHFLGEANQVVPYYIIGITLCILYHRLTGTNKQRIYIAFACAWISEIIYLSSTTMIGLTFFTLITMFFYHKKEPVVEEVYSGFRIKRRKRLFVLLAIGILLVYYLLVVVRIQNYFNSIINFLFGKDATFSTRTIIWDVALNMVKASPIWGYGAISGKYINVRNLYFNGHNIVLQLLLIGGALLLFIVILNIISSLSIVARMQNINIRHAFIGLYVTYFIMSMTEFYPIQLLTFIIALPYFIQILIQKTSENNEQNNGSCKALGE